MIVDQEQRQAVPGTAQGDRSHQDHRRLQVPGTDAHLDGKAALDLQGDMRPGLFSQSGVFATAATLDGNYGQLKIVGTGSLNGTLAVEREQGLYREHMTYDVITADVLNGSFSEVLLPESKPLLVFSMEQTSDTV